MDILFATSMAAFIFGWLFVGMLIMFALLYMLGNRTSKMSRSEGCLGGVISVTILAIALSFFFVSVIIV